MRIAVCITTYKRPEGLRRLLGSLATIERPAPIEEPVRVVVVDNDAERSGEDATRGFDAPGWMGVEYCCEARRGISQARNRALREALGEGLDLADAVAFVDDDEVVEAGWLEALVRTKAECGAGVVAGPVLERFEGEAPGWGIKGGFFGRARHATGTRLERAATGNVLIDAEVLRAVPAWFDEALGLVGGEDELFFRRVAAAGFLIVWADDAVAHEFIEGSRVNVRWVLQRAHRMGATSVYVDRALGKGWGGFRKHLAIGSYRIIKGLGVFLAGMVTGRKHVWVGGMRHVSYGMGHIEGALGRLPEVYR